MVAYEPSSVVNSYRVTSKVAHSAPATLPYRLFFAFRLWLASLNLDTAITALSALMLVILVPSARYLGLSSYLLDLTSSQAVVMGWAPLVSASFLLACRMPSFFESFPVIARGSRLGRVLETLLGAIIPVGVLKPVAFLFPLYGLVPVGVPIPVFLLCHLPLAGPYSMAALTCSSSGALTASLLHHSCSRLLLPRLLPRVWSGSQASIAP